MKTTRTGMADQYTLQQYFAYNSTLAPIILPKIYNTMWGVRGRTKKEVADAVGFHFKVLDSKSSLYRYPHPHVISHLWKHIPAQMMDLRRIQMDNFVAAKDKHHLPIIPVTLNNDSDTFLLHKLRTKYDRVTILAPLGGSKESLKSRETFAKHLHQSFLENARPKSLLETFRFIVRILDKYEWVWVVNPALRLTVDPKWPVHVMLDKLTKEKKDAVVLAFDDCEGKSGSFFVHKSAETILGSLVANVTEGKKSSDEEVWVKFWNLVKADAVIASEPEKLYQVEAKACNKGYYKHRPPTSSAMAARSRLSTRTRVRSCVGIACLPRELILFANKADQSECTRIIAAATSARALSKAAASAELDVTWRLRSAAQSGAATTGAANLNQATDLVTAKCESLRADLDA
ncbi:hypothetical protein HDU99_005010, partial [Rhizoclosmatium hyalinum]